MRSWRAAGASSSPRTRGPTATPSDRSSRWPTPCARSARRCGSSTATPRRRRSWRSRASPDIEIAGPTSTGAFDAAIVMECGDLERAPGVGGLDRYFVINIDHHPGNALYGAVNWFDDRAAACGEMVFDVIARARRAAHRRDRHAPLPRDPDRHRLVPLLEHLAADVRHLPAARRGRRRPGRRGAHGLRQQHARAPEAVRRRAEHAWSSSTTGRLAVIRLDRTMPRRTPAARTTTPRA